MQTYIHPQPTEYIWEIYEYTILFSVYYFYGCFPFYKSLENIRNDADIVDIELKLP